jgi:hypothetical protein
MLPPLNDEPVSLENWIVPALRKTVFDDNSASVARIVPEFSMAVSPAWGGPTGDQFVPTLKKPEPPNQVKLLATAIPRLISGREFIELGRINATLFLNRSPSQPTQDITRDRRVGVQARRWKRANLTTVRKTARGGVRVPGTAVQRLALRARSLRPAHQSSAKCH